MSPPLLALLLVCAQAYGQYVTGQIEDATRLDIVQSSCPGPGACGGMYTANTMASAIETLGMSVPYSSSIPAWMPEANGGQGALHSEKVSEVERAVAALEHCVAHDIKPRDIMTMKAFENAVSKDVAREELAWPVMASSTLAAVSAPSLPPR